MQNALVYIVIAAGISIVLNLILKRFGISQIIGYIFSGTILVYMFNLREVSHSHLLELLGEFGIVFLMFTIGLEISLAKMNSMRREIFFNGILQVTLTSIFFFILASVGFGIDPKSALILSLAFSLSSTAVVLSYLKESKEIYSPYGQKATGILIFQDIAVIPILILIAFLSSDANTSVGMILMETLVSAFVVISLLFVVGKRVMSWLLHFSSYSGLEELFMASVLFIVVGASLLAHYMGFTYSLGAFVAGMIIAETKYHHKVEADIAPFKDILLGTFFIVVGMKIDVVMFVENIGTIVIIFLLVLLVKALIIFSVLSFRSNSSIALKTALALSQVGEFSFVIFAVASSGNLLDEKLAQLLVLIVIFSMVVTPFFISKIGNIVSFLMRDEIIASDMGALASRKHHVVVCGYSRVGKFVAKELDSRGVAYIVVDNNTKQVREALEDGREAYLGDMSKHSIIHALHIESASAVVITLDNPQKKRLICEAVLKYTHHVNLIVKIVTLEEMELLSDLDISVVIDGKEQVARVLVEETMRCKLKLE